MLARLGEHPVMSEGKANVIHLLSHVVLAASFCFKGAKLVCLSIVVVSFVIRPTKNWVYS